MSPEIRVTPSSATVNGSKDASVVPQFVSILNGKGLEIVEVGKNCISPNPPPPCVGRPPPPRPPCVGLPPPSCYGQPPGCYGGR